jgi:dTDP-4-amino-4,6-dideoxygalactose transaminase
MRIVDGAQHWLVADKEIGVGMAISFDPTKNLPSSGNGGAIVTDDKDLHAYALAYRNNGNFAGDYVDIASSNSKMSEQDCAQILVRTKYLDAWQARRADISKFWCDRFRDLNVRCLSDVPGPHAHQKFVMYLPDRNSLHTHLITDGIESKVHYEYTLGDLPMSKTLVKPDLLSTSVMLSRGVLSLPLYPELTDIEVEHIAEKVEDYFNK